MDRIRRIRDWITTIPTMIAFGGVLAIADPFLRFFRLWGERAESIVAQWAQAVMLRVFHLSGARFSAEISEQINPGESYLIVSNHQSMVDIPLIGGTLRKNFPKFVSKQELAKWIPTVSYNLRRGGHLVIDRSKGREAVALLKEFARATQANGTSPVLFVEGSRSRDGRLKEFKQAGMATLMRHAPDMKIVPVAIDGSWKLLRDKFFPLPWGVDIKVRFLAPIDRRPDEGVEATLALIKDQIQGTLDEWRAVPNPA